MVSIDLLPFYLALVVPVGLAALVLVSMLVEARPATRHRQPISPFVRLTGDLSNPVRETSAVSQL